MLIEEFINSNKNWETILAEEPYYITTKRDGEYFLLKYSQIDSDFSNEIVQQCRGSIFKMVDGKAVCVCRPFRKFHNVQEPNAATIDWSTARVEEKVDGSLMKLWWDNGSWHLSTNNTIDAFKAIVNDFNYTFGDLFLRAARVNSLEDFAKYLSRQDTYLFELTTPETQIVIPYEDGVYFLCIKDTATEIEKNYYRRMALDSCFIPGEIKRPIQYPLTSLDDLLAAADAMGQNQEGYVVVDAHNNRVKIKSKGWLMAHYANHNNIITAKYLIKLAKDEMLDDFLALCPQHSNKVEQIKTFIENLKIEAETSWEQVAHLADADPKTFALAVNSLAKNTHYCFEKRKNRELTSYSYIQKMSVPQLVRTYRNKVSQ